MNPGGIRNIYNDDKKRLHELRKSGMLSVLASQLTQLPGNSMYYKDAEKMQSHIKRRAQKNRVYAKPILEMTPEDIEDAITLYVVKVHVVGNKSTGTYLHRDRVEKNMYGNNVYYLPLNDYSRYRLDVGEDYHFKHRSGTLIKPDLLAQIVKHAIQYEDMNVSVYYVMNAKNEAEAVRCITDYTPFKYVNVKDIRSKYDGGKQTKKRQTKKRQFISKKMDIKIFSKHMA